MKILFALIVLLVGIAPARAEFGNWCLVRTADQIVDGCYQIDPDTNPAPAGTFYVDNTAWTGGPGMTWNGTAFIPIPLTPEQEAAVAAKQAEMARQQLYRDDATRVDLLGRLQTATPAQISTWVDGQITCTAAAQCRDQMRAIVKKLLLIIALDARN